MKIPFFVKNLPSGGMFVPKGIKHYNKDNYCIELEPLTYGKMLEYNTAKDSAPNIVLKLATMIDYLIPTELREFPVCDMFCIMTQTSILSGLDIISSEDNSLDKPYYLTNVVCPSCGKKHNKISFSLQDLDYTKFTMPVVSGQIVWRDVHTFSNGDKYTFIIPTINQFYTGLHDYNAMMEGKITDTISTITKLISLTLAFNKFEPNKKIVNTDFKINFDNIKDVFYNLTGSDAMKIERLYYELIQPVVLFKNFCDCEGGSVLDVTYYITDVLRLLIDNSDRIVSQIYLLPKETKLGPEFNTIQFGGESFIPDHKEIRRRILEESKTRDQTGEFYD